MKNKKVYHLGNAKDDLTVTVPNFGEKLTLKNPHATGQEKWGYESCHSCRNLDFNGYACAEPLSPYAGKAVNPEKSCVWWSPMRSAGRPPE